MSQALRSLDQALSATKDTVLRTALGDVRTTVSSSLSPLGVKPKIARPCKVLASNARGKLDAEGVLTCVRNSPGQRGEDLAATLGSDTAADPQGTGRGREGQERGGTEGDEVLRGRVATWAGIGTYWVASRWREVNS